MPPAVKQKRIQKNKPKKDLKLKKKSSESPLIGTTLHYEESKFSPNYIEADSADLLEQLVANERIDYTQCSSFHSEQILRSQNGSAKPPQKAAYQTSKSV